MTRLAGITPVTFGYPAGRVLCAAVGGSRTAAIPMTVVAVSARVRADPSVCAGLAWPAES